MTTIAIDASALTGPPSGTPRYILELIQGLGKLAVAERFVVLRRGVAVHSPVFPGTETISANVPLWLTAFVPYVLIRERARLVHFPYAAMPPWVPCRSIVTVHDLAFVRNPEWFTPRMEAMLRRTWLPAVRRADHVLCGSEFTRREVVDLLGVQPTRVTVTPYGVGEMWRLAAEQDALPHPNGGRPYVLAVGTIQPRKNYGRLIEAFAQASSQIRDLDLCLAGSFGWGPDNLAEIAQQHGIADRVRLPGSVGDQELLAWYHHARALAFVSLYEGFGFPLLEAMAQGIPCLTSDGSSLAEVGGDAAERAAPQDVNAIAQGLLRVCNDEELRARLRQQGLARAREFTWERCARTTLQAYRATYQR
jgi:glycosyltransferase involved in cell wall biosynthesis